MQIYNRYIKKSTAPFLKSQSLNDCGSFVFSEKAVQEIY